MVVGATKIRRTKNREGESIGELYALPRVPKKIFAFNLESKEIYSSKVAVMKEAYAKEVYQLTIMGGQSIIATGDTEILTTEGLLSIATINDRGGVASSSVPENRLKLLWWSFGIMRECFLSKIDELYNLRVYSIATHDPKECVLANGFVVQFKENV